MRIFLGQETGEKNTQSLRTLALYSATFNRSTVHLVHAMGQDLGQILQLR